MPQTTFNKNGIIEATGDYVVCLDFNGNEWIFEGAEDWCIHDFASLLMWDNETENIEDDIIINAFYSGYVPN